MWAKEKKCWNTISMTIISIPILIDTFDFCVWNASKIDYSFKCRKKNKQIVEANNACETHLTLNWIFKSVNINLRVMWPLFSNWFLVLLLIFVYDLYARQLKSNHKHTYKLEQSQTIRGAKGKIKYYKEDKKYRQQCFSWKLTLASIAITISSSGFWNK